MYQPNSHIGYHRLGSAHSTLNNPRYRILQSSLATLLQLKNQEEDAFKIAIYENSIVLIQKELSALTVHS